MPLFDITSGFEPPFYMPVSELLIIESKKVESIDFEDRNWIKDITIIGGNYFKSYNADKTIYFSQNKFSSEDGSKKIAQRLHIPMMAGILIAMVTASHVIVKQDNVDFWHYVGIAQGKFNNSGIQYLGECQVFENHALFGIDTDFYCPLVRQNIIDWLIILNGEECN